MSHFSYAFCQQRPERNSAFYLNIGGEPTALNPISHGDAYKTKVKAYMFETLLDQDIYTYEWKPKLATSWEVSEDKTVFKFKLREGVMWHDGKELTAEDVKFSFDIIFEDKFNTIPLRPYFEGIKEVRIIDKYNVEIITKIKTGKTLILPLVWIYFQNIFIPRDEKEEFL